MYVCVFLCVLMCVYRSQRDDVAGLPREILGDVVDDLSHDLSIQLEFLETKTQIKKRSIVQKLQTRYQKNT